MATDQPQGDHWALAMRPATPRVGGGAVLPAAPVSQLLVPGRLRPIDIARTGRERLG